MHYKVVLNWQFNFNSSIFLVNSDTETKMGAMFILISFFCVAGYVFYLFNSDNQCVKIFLKKAMKVVGVFLYWLKQIECLIIHN